MAPSDRLVALGKGQLPTGPIPLGPRIARFDDAGESVLNDAVVDKRSQSVNANVQ